MVREQIILVQYVLNGFFINSFNTKYIKFLLTSKSDSKLYTVETLISNPQRPGCDWNTKKLNSQRSKKPFSQEVQHLCQQKSTLIKQIKSNAICHSRDKRTQLLLCAPFSRQVPSWEMISEIEIEGSRGRLCRSRIQDIRGSTVWPFKKMKYNQGIV